MKSIKLLTAVMFLILSFVAAPQASAGFGISITVEPPPLPVYVQPEIPGPGYLWTPGYWAYDDDDSDYYWVPGAWAEPPEVGLLWTPPYYGWNDGVYVFHDGYWGPHVGFYGGISYGFGYTGVGFAGGYWSGGVFNYNRSVTRIGNTTIIQNTYVKNVTNNNTTNVSYNGGKNGTAAQPVPQDKLALADRHVPPTPAQAQQIAVSQKDPKAKLGANSGKPPVAALQKAGDFKSNVVHAKTSGGPIVIKNSNSASGAAKANAAGNANASNREGERKLAGAAQTGTKKGAVSGNAKTAVAKQGSGPAVTRTRAPGNGANQKNPRVAQGQRPVQRNAKKAPPRKQDDKKKPA